MLPSDSLYHLDKKKTIFKKMLTDPSKMKCTKKTDFKKKRQMGQNQWFIFAFDL